MSDTQNDNKILELVMMVFNDKDAAKEAQKVLKEAQRKRN